VPSAEEVAQVVRHIATQYAVTARLRRGRWRLPMSELPMPGFKRSPASRPVLLPQIRNARASCSTRRITAPGCGHGMWHKLLARAIDELGVQDRTVLISPVGCGVFAYYYFGRRQCAGGPRPAHPQSPPPSSAAGPNSIVVSYQGDGDLAAIGTAEILHAANRGEPITVIFINNAIYGMTGGQLAPTTPIGGQEHHQPLRPQHFQ